MANRARDYEPPPLNATDVMTFFEVTASEWDTMRLTDYDAQAIETLAEATAIDDPQTVLDVGTGIGLIAAGVARLGMEEVIAEVLPGEKADKIADLQTEARKVAMLGDGVNCTRTSAGRLATTASRYRSPPASSNRS